MSEPALDWSSADVRDGKLTVDLRGDAPRSWQATFETTARLLGGGDWQQVKLKKRRLRVSGVTPGSEDKLRHFLESVVQQANAKHRSEAEGSEDGEIARSDERDDDSEERAQTPDSQMAERFRSFAETSQSDS